MGPRRVSVAELRSGDRVRSTYLLQDFQIRNRKDGNNFVTLVLRDATGKVTGIMWDNFEQLRAQTIKVNDIVEVTGEVQTFQNQLQMRVSRITKVDDSEVVVQDFLPSTPHSLEELTKEFWTYVGQIKDRDLARLVHRIFEDRNRWERFSRAPSAISMHQGYIGGLLEHTVCVTRNAVRIAEHYPQTNHDLLIAGALLHDIGKIAEFVYDRRIAYSDVGRLIGHIPIGHALIEVECSRIRNFPVAKKILVQHMILSHHGHLEFGSPKRPKTLEAIILHHADVLDAEISNYLELTMNVQKSGGKWEYSSMFERYIYAGTSEALDEPEAIFSDQQVVEASEAQHKKLALDLDDALPADDLLKHIEAERED